MWDDYELEEHLSDMQYEMQNDHYELEGLMDLQYEMLNDDYELEDRLMELQYEIENDFGPNPLEEFLYEEWYYKTESRKAAQHRRISNTKTKKCGFKVGYNLQQFKPQKVTVKVEGNCVMVKVKRNRSLFSTSSYNMWDDYELEEHLSDVQYEMQNDHYELEGLMDLQYEMLNDEDWYYTTENRKAAQHKRISNTKTKKCGFKASPQPLPTTNHVVPTTCSSTPAVTRMGPQGLTLKKRHTLKKRRNLKKRRTLKKSD